MKSWDARRYAIAAVILAVVSFLALNIAANGWFRSAQVDLTQNRVFTLSDATKKVLADVREPIELRLFVSRDLLDASPGLGNYATQVQEFIERYVALSGGKINLEVVDPKPFSPEEDRAVGFQLQGVPLGGEGEFGYFGLAGTNTTDDTDVIGFFQPQRERFLEYDLTRLVYNLANPKKKVIGLVSGIPLDADPTREYKPWRVIEIMKQFFEVRSMGLEPEITEDLDVLMVVHPIGLSDKSLYAIDQWVLKGGKTMVFIDPFSEEGSRANAAMRLPPDFGSDLEELFKAWGIRYERDEVLGDRETAQRVSAGLDPRGRPIITDYVAWNTLRQAAFKADDVLTADLQVINIATAGFITPVEGGDAKIEPLLTSTEQSGVVAANRVRRNPNPAAILEDFKSDGKQRIIAARVSGTVKSAFADGPPEEKKDGDKKDEKPDSKKVAEMEKAKAAHVAEAKQPINMIVVTDSDILADSFWLQVQDFFGQRLVVPSANNADFVVNALDNLSGSSGLIGLRGRGLTDRSFERVDELQKAAEEKFRSREQALAKELQDVQKKLEELQTKEKAGGGATILTEEQQKEIEGFRTRIVEIRRELREVRFNLQKDIDELDATLKVINIGAMPAIVALIAVVLLIARQSRARRRHSGTVG